MTIAKLEVPESAQDAALLLLAGALRPRGWYAHGVGDGMLRVAFPDGVHAIRAADTDACADLRRRGRACGIPDRQMPFERLHEQDHPHGHAGDAVLDRRTLFVPSPRQNCIPRDGSGTWCGRVLSVNNTDEVISAVLYHDDREDVIVFPSEPRPEPGDLIGCAWSAEEHGNQVSRWTVLTATIAVGFWSDAATNDREVALVRDNRLHAAILARHAILRSIRSHLDGLHFIEAETPTLLPMPDIAPVEHLRAMRRDATAPTWLRICPENHLKRLVVSGFDRVYEIGRNYRGDPPSPRHQPEFTSLELYQAWGSWEDMAVVMADLIAGATRAVLGTSVVSIGSIRVDLGRPWRRITFRDACRTFLGLDPDKHQDCPSLASAMMAIGIAAHRDAPRRVLINRIADHIEPFLVDPTLLTEHPMETICVARRSHLRPTCLERFEAFVGGLEIAHAFSELSDPVEQRLRMQRLADERGVAVLDETFLHALELGLPPTGGLGIGIDRLVMLATGEPIDRTIAFPHGKDIP